MESTKNHTPAENLTYLKNDLFDREEKHFFESSIDIFAEKYKRMEDLEKLSKDLEDFRIIYDLYHQKIDKNNFVTNITKWKINQLILKTKDWVLNGESLEQIREDFENIINSELDNLEKEILIKENARWYIQKNIDIIWEFEDFSENEDINNFMKLFTVEYLNLKKGKFNTENKYLDLEEIELEDILKNISEKLEWYPILKLNIKIKDWIIEKEFTTENRTEVEKIKMENIQRTWLNSSEDREVFNKKNYNKINNDNDKVITTSEFLELHGFSKQTEIIISDLFWEENMDFSKLTRKQKIMIFLNLENLIKYITYIESEWGKFVNNISGSSAKWPFQIIDWHINWKKRTMYVQWKYTTFEIWLRRAQQYFWWNLETNIISENTPEWIKKAILEKNILPNDLTHNQTIDLFLIWSFYGSSNKKNRADLVKVLIEWDFKAAERIYSRHHSNPDSATLALMKRTKKIFEKDFQNLK